MARNGDGTVQGVGDTDNLQFYIERAVSIDSQCPFDPDDKFEVHVLPHSGLVLRPPDAEVSLLNVLKAFDSGPQSVVTTTDLTRTDLRELTL